MITNQKIFVLLIFLFLAIFLAQFVFADEQTIKIGVFDNPPKINIDENENVSGIYSTIIEYIAKKEGWKIEYVIGTFQENLEKAEKGEIDVLADVSYTEERAKYLDYPNESVITSYGIVITNPNFQPVLFRELDKKTIATLKGSVFLSTDGYPALEKLLKIKSNLIQTPNYETAFLMLDEGKIDAIIANDVYGFYYEKTHPDKKYIFTNLLFMPNNQFFAFPKDANLNKLLIEKIDSALIELKSNQTSIYYQEIYKMKGGYKETTFEIPVWLQAALVFIIGVLLISLVFLFVVTKQKKEIQKVNGELENTGKKLENSNRLKDLFIDIMRHDLLNPTTVIKMNTQLLLSTEKNLNKKSTLDLILNGCNRLIDRLNSASLLSKLEEGKVPLEYNKINLKLVINNIFKDVTHLAKEKNIKLISTIKEDAFIEAIPLIHEVFFNLITNAIKYGLKNEEVIVSIAKDKNNYLISVANSGETIPNKYKKSIFERFSKFEKGIIKGSGLGLTITKKIVEIHKGKVWVEDNPKGGCIFVVELPTKQN